MINSLNTSLAAQGALAHRLQRRPRPNHNNAKSGARPCLPPLSFNMAGGEGQKQKQKKFTKVLKCPEMRKQNFDPPLPPSTSGLGGAGGRKPKFSNKILEMS